ncbi:MAG: SGNH/GDSL hydrolase family protein [Hyphomicrobium sp.]|nr:SGNH/GDSL hydrolase family protein [Hyphomicrobium sp.]
MREVTKVFGSAILFALIVLSQLATAVAEKVPTATRQPAECSVPDSVAWGAPIADSVLGPLQHKKEPTIVAFGSSSTAGVGASGPQNGYVAQFSRALETQMDGLRIPIINAGVSGNTTADMLRRLKHDVLDRKPTVVIWQTGTNDALRQLPLDHFRRDLRRGIADMKARSIKVILIDQQDFAGAATVKNYSDYVSVMHEVAQQENVTLLHRYRVMRYLALQHRGGMNELLAKDRLHMSDVAHKCVGELLADGIHRLIR